MADDTSIGISDSDERIEFDGAGDISLLGCNVGIGTSSPAKTLDVSGDLRLGSASGSPVVSSVHSIFFQLDTDNDSTGQAFEIRNDGSAYNDGTLLMRVQENGNVGIGTAAPDSPLHVVKGTANAVQGGHHAATVGIFERTSVNASGAVVTILGDNDAASILNFGDQDDADVGYIGYWHGDNYMSFSTNASEAMRINSHGWFYLHSNGVEPGAGQGGWSYQNADINSPPVVAHRIRHSRGSGVDSSSMHMFYNGNGAVGSIATAGSGTSFNTTSDYRQKENEVSISDGLERLNQLKPYRFNFKADPNETLDGFFAHEAQEIVPQAVTGEKDDTETVINVVVNESDMVLVEGVTEEQWIIGKSEEKYPSNSTWESSKVVPDYQKIDHSGLVPLLIAAVQELSAKVEALENE
jgi:hypothetical protein